MHTKIDNETTRKTNNWHIKQQIILVRRGRWYNTQLLLYPHPLTCQKEFFFVLCVSIMCLTRCSTDIFWSHLYFIFYEIYFTDAYYCTGLFTVLWCCKNQRKPYWNGNCVINTSFTYAKLLLLLTCPIGRVMEAQKLR